MIHCLDLETFFPPAITPPASLDIFVSLQQAVKATCKGISGSISTSVFLAPASHSPTSHNQDPHYHYSCLRFALQHRHTTDDCREIHLTHYPLLYSGGSLNQRKLQYNLASHHSEYHAFKSMRK